MLKEAIKQLEQNIRMFSYAKAQFEGLEEYQSADDMEQTIKTTEESLKNLRLLQEEIKKGILPCQECGDKVLGTWHCKPCAHKLFPWDRDI